MRAYVRFELSGGDSVDLGHGDIIGRLGAARLSVADPSVSEAHAMVSQRGDELLLLGLRGRFVVEDKPISKLVLEVGQEIRLSRSTTLRVTEVALPSEILALSAPGLGRQVLSGVCSIVADGAVRLVPRFEAQAAAWVFNVDGAWLVKVGDGAAAPLAPGDGFDAAGKRFTAVAVDLDHASQDETQKDGAIQRSLRIVSRYESVHLFRSAEPAVVLSGNAARIISELAATRVPTPWDVVAGEVWAREPGGAAALRARFDAAMMRLRRKLRSVGIRDDLVRADGHGSLELVLYPGDVLEDEG